MKQIVLVVLTLFLAGCAGNNGPVKLEKGKIAPTPLSHTLQCFKAETWNKWICKNEKSKER